MFSLFDSKPICTVEQGPAGVSNVIFAPDSQHLLVWADFQLRITIWAVFKKSAVAHIKFPKFSNRCYDFTSTTKKLISPQQNKQNSEENEEDQDFDNEDDESSKTTTKYGMERKTYFAYGERRECKDYISIVHTETWELVKTFPIKTKHLHDLKWSPNGKGRLICCWDSILDYQLYIYSPTGQCIHSFSAYENALGIRAVRWSPTAQLLAIGSFDMKIRLLNHLTWGVLSEYEHKPAITSPEILIFKEVEIMPSGSSISSPEAKTRYVIEDSPITLNIVNNPALQSKKTAADQTQKPKNGVALMEWSHDCKYICSKVEEFPNVLWIWDTSKLSLCSILVQLYPIKDVKWDPSSKNRLALCTSNSRVYFWSEEGTSCVDIPSHGFVVTSLDWDKNGKSLLLKGKNAFCIAYP